MSEYDPLRPLTPWQRARTYQRVAERLRAEGRHADADRLEEFARSNAAAAVVEGTAETGGTLHAGAREEEDSEP